MEEWLKADETLAEKNCVLETAHGSKLHPLESQKGNVGLSMCTGRRCNSSTKTKWGPLIAIVSIALSNVAILVVTAQSPDLSKLEAILQTIYSRYDTQWKFHKAKDLPSIDPSIKSLLSVVVIDFSGDEPAVPVAVTVRDQGQDLRAHGFQVQAQLGEIVTLKIPISRLPLLASLPSVVYVQASVIERSSPPGDGKIQTVSRDLSLARDIATVAPKNCKVLLENNKVRMIEVRLKPGESIGLHSLASHLIYAIGSSSAKYTSPEGKVTLSQLKAGQAIWRDAVTQSWQNAGKTETRVLIVELK